MNKNTKGIITIVAVAAVVLAIWHYTHQNAKAYAKAIIKLGGSSNYAVLITFEEAFLKAWAKAITAGKSEFTYQSVKYNTQGGKKIV